MKVVCINKVDGFTIGKTYEAIDSNVESGMGISGVLLYRLKNDYNELTSFNLSKSSGFWLNFETLDVIRQEKLNDLGI